MCGGQIRLCAAFFFWQNEKHINKIPWRSQENAAPGRSRDSPEKSREILVYAFSCLLAFSGPIEMLKPQWHSSPFQGRTPDWPVSLVLPGLYVHDTTSCVVLPLASWNRKIGNSRNWRKIGQNRESRINSVQTRGIVETSGFTRGVCKKR